MILSSETIYIILNFAGEVQFSKNGSTPLVFMHVDQTLQLWAFFDVYGSTQKVRILGSYVEAHHPHSSSGQLLYMAQYMEESYLTNAAVVTLLLMVFMILPNCCVIALRLLPSYSVLIHKSLFPCHYRIVQKTKWKIVELAYSVSIWICPAN